MKPRSRAGLRTILNQAGTTVVEAAVTLGMASVLMGISAVGVNKGFLDTRTAQQELVNDLRQTRMKAIRTNAHYRMTFGSGSYQVERLQDDDGDGVWQLDAAVQAVSTTLPSDVQASVSAADDATTVEFDSRGMMVPQDGALTSAALSVTLNDSDSGESAQITVWPSGQIELNAANTQAVS